MLQLGGLALLPALSDVGAFDAAKEKTKYKR
jgi:hypothetical protein